MGFIEKPGGDAPSGTGRGGHAQGDKLWDIENVIGSDFDDVIMAQYGDTDNVFLGGKGNDKLYGRGGDDVLSGGAGADIIDGGEGSDLADYSGSDAGVHIDLIDGTVTGGHAEGDRLIGIEHLTGSAHNDILVGDDGSNMIGGGAGDDRLFGRGGDDLLAGGDGNDALYGDQGQDILLGDAGDDLLWGGSGDDILEGGAGADVLDGGDGQDTASYAESEAGVHIDLGNGTAEGGHAEGDTLTGIEPPDRFGPQRHPGRRRRQQHGCGRRRPRPALRPRRRRHPRGRRRQ
ncbi:MAG: calcium-binding protein [Hyphomicrobium sp.]